MIPLLVLFWKLSLISLVIEFLDELFLPFKDSRVRNKQYSHHKKLFNKQI